MIQQKAKENEKGWRFFWWYIHIETCDQDDVELNAASHQENNQKKKRRRLRFRITNKDHVHVCELLFLLIIGILVSVAAHAWLKPNLRKWTPSQKAVFAVDFPWSPAFQDCALQIQNTLTKSQMKCLSAIEVAPLTCSLQLLAFFSEEEKIEFLVNPLKKEQDGAKRRSIEKSILCPQQTRSVERTDHISVKFLNWTTGQSQTLFFQERSMAYCLQHSLDLLNGQWIC
jgi:peptide deformylase